MVNIRHVFKSFFAFVFVLLLLLCFFFVVVVFNFCNDQYVYFWGNAFAVLSSLKWSCHNITCEHVALCSIFLQYTCVKFIQVVNGIDSVEEKKIS